MNKLTPLHDRLVRHVRTLQREGASHPRETRLLDDDLDRPSEVLGQRNRFRPLLAAIYQLVEEGRLPACRVRTAGSRRGRVQIARVDLEAFLAGARQTATQAPVRVDVDGLLQKVRRD